MSFMVLVIVAPGIPGPLPGAIAVSHNGFCGEKTQRNLLNLTQGVQCMILEKVLKFLSEKPFTKKSHNKTKRKQNKNLLFMRAVGENYTMAQKVFLQL